MPKMKDQYTMQDPRHQYAQPDIEPDQMQSEPGLESKMRPEPQHGEDTYIGHGRLEGRKALITGGDSGIGKAVAIAYAKEGADVVIVYLPEEREDATKTLEVLREEGHIAAGIEGDLKDEDFAKKVIDKTIEKLGGLDILINNAGKQEYTKDIQDITTEKFDHTFKTNIYATFWLTKAALPHMPPGATIINTTSIQSYHPSPGLLDYAATKGAITTFTKGLAQMVIGQGIRVNAVAPGPIWTVLQPSHGQSKEKLEHFGEQTPMGRAGQPAELAPTYVFLASQESSYITGEIIGATGGSPIS